MTKVRINTANIPKYVTDAICADLLKSIKEYIRNNPGAAEELEERGRKFFQRTAEKETQQKDEPGYITLEYEDSDDTHVYVSGSCLVVETKLNLP